MPTMQSRPIRPNAAPADAHQLLLRIQRTLERLRDRLEQAVHGHGQPTGVRPPGIDRLTDREREVIRNVCDGRQRTYEVIADDMDIHFGTLKCHLASIYQKMEVNSRGGLVLLFVTWGVDKQEERGA